MARLGTPGCEGYEDKKAPCICVTGQDKATGDHKKIHDLYDQIEDSKMVAKPDGKMTAGSWSYADASKEGCKATAQVTGCDQACLEAQVNAYHQQGKGKTPNIADGTGLRADSGGSRTPEGFVPASKASAKVFE